MGDRGRRHDPAGRLFIGVMFVVAGVGLLLHQLGVLKEDWRDIWPVVVIALGFGILVTARYAERVGTGITFLIFGAWWIAVERAWYGLTWHNSWPIALVAIGAGALTHAIAAWFMPDWAPKFRREEHCDEA